jgi:hypothetical protein
MPIGNPRVADFDKHLRILGVPISGISNSNNGVDPYPQGITINYLPEATGEQIALAEAEKASFDWRPRRLIARNTIVNTLASMTAAQQNAVLRHIAAAYIRQNKNEALDVIATLGANLPIDEVDPNP